MFVITQELIPAESLRVRGEKKNMRKPSVFDDSSEGTIYFMSSFTGRKLNLKPIPCLIHIRFV